MQSWAQNLEETNKMALKAVKEAIEFEEGDLGPLEVALRSLEVVDGWVNVTPGVPTDLLVEDRSLFSFLVGSRAPSAPLATWMPVGQGSPGKGTLGVLHGRGRLHREGLAGLASIPSSWRCKQDHARRGLLFVVEGASATELAETMVAVVEELATVTTTGRYLAEVFRRP